MKSVLLFILGSILITQSIAQSFPGYSTGNYAGVNGVFSNPANIADSRYRFDFNLFSVHALGGNNRLSFNSNKLSESFDAGYMKRSFSNQQAKSFNGLISIDLHGPSLMFNAGKKTAIALTSRLRVMTNATRLDGTLLSKLADDSDRDNDFSYSINSNQNMTLSVNAWRESGLSFARVVKNKGPHFLKAGLTFKYLLGVTNAHINLNSIKATLNEDAGQDNRYLSNATGYFSAGFQGIDLTQIDAIDPNSLKTTFKDMMKNKGIGADFGMVYEYRPDHENYTSEAPRNDLNKYKFRIGFALTDLGKIKYKKEVNQSGAYNISITGAERLYLSELDDMDGEDMNSFFQSRPEYFTPEGSDPSSYLKVALPTALHLNIDYHLHRGFYVNLASQLPLSLSGTKPTNARQYSTLTVTPRYEGKVLGFYVPFTYSSLTDLNAGVSLRLGPLFIGSGSALTAIIKNSKQADVFVGFWFGVMKKRN